MKSSKPGDKSMLDPEDIKINEVKIDGLLKGIWKV